MVMGSRMQHGSAQPTAAHALQGKRNARVVRCDEDNAQPAAAASRIDKMRICYR